MWGSSCGHAGSMALSWSVIDDVGMPWTWRAASRGEGHLWGLLLLLRAEGEGVQSHPGPLWPSPASVCLVALWPGLLVPWPGAWGLGRGLAAAHLFQQRHSHRERAQASIIYSEPEDVVEAGGREGLGTRAATMGAIRWPS